VATLTLFAVGACSLAKLAGYALCVLVFGGGRLLLAAWPTNRVGKVGRRSASLALRVQAQAPG
jgi:hypothetical protein